MLSLEGLFDELTSLKAEVAVLKKLVNHNLGIPTEPVSRKKPENIYKIIPPKLEWIEAYCKERKNNIIPKAFFEYYAAANWMRGYTKIRDWAACIRTWELKNHHKKPAQSAISIQDALKIERGE